MASRKARSSLDTRSTNRSTWGRTLGHGRSSTSVGAASSASTEGTARLGGEAIFDRQRSASVLASSSSPRRRSRSAPALLNDSISRRREASDAVRACAVDATEDASASRSARRPSPSSGSAVGPADAGAVSSVNRRLSSATWRTWSPSVAARRSALVRSASIAARRVTRSCRAVSFSDTSCSTRDQMSSTPFTASRRSVVSTAPVSSVTGVHTVSATDRQSSGRPRSRAAWRSSRRWPTAFQSTNARATASRSSAEPCSWTRSSSSTSRVPRSARQVSRVARNASI